jgi:hypothetical protein
MMIMDGGLNEDHQLQNLQLIGLHGPESILQHIYPDHIHQPGSVVLRHLGEIFRSEFPKKSSVPVVFSMRIRKRRLSGDISPPDNRSISHSAAYQDLAASIPTGHALISIIVTPNSIIIVSATAVIVASIAAIIIIGIAI